MSAGKLKLICIILILSPIFLAAQENSPYSRFGVGDLLSQSYASSRSMAGLSAAYFDSQNINFVNPASYAFLKMSTYEFGVNANYLSTSNGEISSKSGNGNISYLALGFPVLRNKMGMSFGLIPYSRAEYNIEEESIKDTLIGSEVLNYKGEGSLYQVYTGFGYTFKGFSIGVNIGAMFGKLDNIKKIGFPDLENAYTTRATTENKINGFLWNPGLGYSKAVGKDLAINFGLTGKFPIKVNVDQEITWENIVEVGDAFTVKDSIPNIQQGTDGKMQLPPEYSIGFTLNNSQNWRVGVEFNQAFWSQYEGIQDFAMKDSWRFKLGGEATPARKDPLSKKRRSITYRAGFYYGKSNLGLEDIHLDEFGTTFGFGIPVSRSGSYNFFSKLNVAMEVGSRGTSDLIREVYYRTTIGLTLNDRRWFIKNKID